MLSPKKKQDMKTNMTAIQTITALLAKLRRLYLPIRTRLHELFMDFSLDCTNFIDEICIAPPQLITLAQKRVENRMRYPRKFALFRRSWVFQLQG